MASGDPSGMIDRLLAPLPRAVFAAETTGDLEVPLYAAEHAALAGAVARRRAEFTTGRALAGRALAAAGVTPRPCLAPADAGMPPWPPGYVGSMTHCEGYRAAAVAARDDYVTIGIDAEPHAPLPPGVLEHVTRAAEREQLRALAEAEPHTAWDRVLFSAKESIYKSWYPLQRRWLGFEDIRVDLTPTSATTGSVTVELVRAGDSWPGSLQMCWVVHDEIILTLGYILAP